MGSACAAVLLIFLLSCLLPLAHSRRAFTEYGARQNFERKFDEVCGAYPFVERWLELQRRPLDSIRDRYVVYSYSEKGLGSNGGLGDRLGGLISAIAYALRSDRRLLISGDKAFEDSFRPYVRASEVLRLVVSCCVFPVF
jgi:hypothetical protein